MGALPAEKWQDVINELVRVTRVGGWIELIETEGVFPMTNILCSLQVLDCYLTMRYAPILYEQQHD